MANNDVDVLVIGAGMGGAAISKRLSEEGISVVCLEQGDWVHPSDYAHHHSDWEMKKRRVWADNPNVRQLPSDYPVTGESNPLLYNAVGGSTIHFVGQWPRMKPSDFRKGTEHGKAASIDWPISYEELAPFYDMNDEEVVVSGKNGDPANPPRPPRQCPPIAPGKHGLKFADGCRKLGWHWWYCDNAIVTREQNGRRACNACGVCNYGCPRGSLGTADQTYWPKALKNGVDLRTRARVERITTGPDGTATGATYIDLTTEQHHRVTADLVVLCAGGVGTPRILLLSETGKHSNGLCNENDLVGRHLMHHTWAFVDCWYDEPIEGYKGAFGVPFKSQEFYETSGERNFLNGLMLQAASSYGPVQTALGDNVGESLPWGESHREEFDRRFGYHMNMSAQGEDLPRRDNRVTLDPSKTDSSGLPAAHIDYNLGENDRKLSRFGIKRVKEIARASGARETRSTGIMDEPPAWHLMGTCRMGHSPDDSVTNKYNQTWEIPNLLIADGSSLTTAGAVNPTSTIGAVALRCAEYIKKRGDEIVRQSQTPTNEEAPDL